MKLGEPIKLLGGAVINTNCPPYRFWTFLYSEKICLSKLNQRIEIISQLKTRWKSRVYLHLN